MMLPAKDGKRVEAEIVEPRRSFFHPASGVVILGLDWLAFGGDLVTGFIDALVIGVVVFAVTYVAVEWIQRRWHGDPPRKARLKALLGALAAGIPLPITGTLLGTVILFLSGLQTFRRDHRT
jgi:hypothetical protein